MFFKQIIGQEETKNRLCQLVDHNQIPHALLFAGNEGVGKFPMALAFARYIHCTNRSEHEACGVCPSCKKYDQLVHPDLHFVFPIYKSAAQKKEVCDDYLPEFRSFVLKNGYFNYSQWMSYIDCDNSQGQIYTNEALEIMKKLNLKAFEAEYKIMIIWLPEKMHETCSNKILKLLEEPPAKTLFLLVSESADHILLTIQSRTQRIHLRNIEENTLAAALSERFLLEAPDAKHIAHYANGNYLRALECISINEDKKRYHQYFVNYMRQAYTVANLSSRDNPAQKFDALNSLKNISEEIASLGREKQKQFLNYCQHIIRENYIANIQTPELNYMTSEEAQFAFRFAPYLNERNILSFYEEFATAETHIEQNVNAKMVFFDLALKTIVLLKK
ncbi:MAG: ATP-binding protein [Bacteroidales bacterium]